MLENVRVALQRALGTSYHFWRSERSVDVLNERALELLDDVGVKAYAELPAVELPYGRKRALEIATTLALDPEMLLLDEPMAGMGAEDIKRTSALIRRVAKDRTVLMVEHNLSVVADLSDRITVLARGEVLAEGTYAEVSKNPQVIEAYMGTGGGGMAEAQLAVRDLHGWYGESHVLHGMTLRRERRRGGDAARPQRRRQDHHHARHHGHAGQAQGLDALRGPGADPAQVGPHRPAGARLLPGGARHLRQPQRAREPDAAAEGQGRRAFDRADLRRCFPT